MTDPYVDSLARLSKSLAKQMDDAIVNGIPAPWWWYKTEETAEYIEVAHNQPFDRF